MTERLNITTETGQSAPFSPAGDFSIQASIAEGSNAFVDVTGQVDAAAPWVSLGGISPSTVPPILRFAKCMNVRIDVYRNAAGKPLKVWSGE